ncbi:Duplicated homeodomain-like superfamily protein [Dorcoceras hygrometricum]|uniref:Duplicated homeodomain-like superfamily protein n=1 Tax=Dorcoceras hygrometricum TaxID=472368 RepID=A0A2Z7D7R9_9LAMI|nr:Duplicated homeodomain-like superfamily protein [Dorcoceras hygrometricum]
METIFHPAPYTPWTKEENKLFERALAMYDEKRTPNRWFKVAAMIPGKSVCDVMNHYRELVEDVSNIEAGLVPIPGYLSSSFTLELEDGRGFDHVMCRKRGRTSVQERRKGVPWTEDEHRSCRDIEEYPERHFGNRRFLAGLQKHGKGDWRSISRNFVISKTPTQVASHAQKYYLRQVSRGKDKRRPSIHDMTIVDLSNASSECYKIPRPAKSYGFKPMQKPTIFDDGGGSWFWTPLLAIH